MNTTALKLGFIGGAIESAVGVTHRIASQMDGRWVLSAGCFSTHENINTKTGSLWGVDPRRVYSNYKELLAAEYDDIDAIVILTPTPSHASIVIEALELGYAVICEKALAKSVSEAQEIKRVIEKTKGYLAVTYNYTGYPMIRELQSIVQRGGLGRLQQINIEMPQEGYLRLDKDNNRSKIQEWRLKDEQIPTLSLDLGVHLHHMIRFISDESPVELISVNNNFGYFEGVVDNTICIARYTGNIDCQIWFGKTALGNSNGLKIRVFGEKGSAEWYQMCPESLILHDNMGRSSTLERSLVDLKLANDVRYNRFKAGHPAGFIEAFANLYYDIADDLISFRRGNKGASPWVHGVDVALEGLTMLNAMHNSNKKKAWTRLHNIEGG